MLVHEFSEVGIDKQLEADADEEIVEVSNSCTLQPLESRGSDFNALGWRPDGRYLAAGDVRGGCWWLWPAPERAPRRQGAGARTGG